MERSEHDRIVGSHDAGYWNAQRRGFALIAALAESLEEADRQYVKNVVIEDWRGIEWCPADAWLAANKRSGELAELASYGHALSIIDAQRRDDELARLIRRYRCRHDADYIPW